MFSLRRIISLAVVLPVMAAFVLQVSGQTAVSNQKRRFDAIPGMLLPQLQVLGAQVQTKGKERTTLIGQFTDATGRETPVQVIHQIPNLVDLQGFTTAEIKFDGTAATAIRRAPLEETLLEAFSSDTVEGVLSSVQTGAAVRLLGRGFKPDAKVAPGYAGPAYDIFEVTSPVLSLPDQPVRMKLYYFDTQSGVLLSTRYSDLTVKPALQVETRFSNWQMQDGSAYPGLIERYENGLRVFSFAATAVSSGPAVDPNNFR